jgi:transcriptional regulator with XRE-family HTH domain
MLYGSLSAFLFRLMAVAVPKHRRVLAERIRAYRKAAGLSQERLAEKADLSAVFVSHVECGIGNPSFDTLVTLSKALKVRLRDLVVDL